jgi:chromosome segregation ATPase
MLPMPRSAPTRKSITLWLTVLAYALLLAASGIAVYRQAGVISGQAAQLSRHARENEELRRQLQRLTSAIAAPAASEPAPAPYSATPHASRSTPEELALAEQRARRLQESLAQSTTEVARLEARVSDLQSRADSGAGENHRLSTELETGKKDLAAANQAIETVRAELKATADRLAQLEAASAKWKQDSASAKQSAAQLDQTLTDLEDVVRRREMYLNNMLRRYREITEQYRAISGVMDSRRDRQSAPASSPEISRIQNAIALAEEDLRQIQALDAQAQRLEKKLPVK